MGRWVFVVVAALVASCGSAPDNAVTRWTLEVDGKDTEVTVPAHLPVPDREMTYTLRSTITVPAELRDEPPSFVIPYFAGRATLQVDGFDAVRTEHDLVNGYRARGPHSWQFPDEVRGRAQVTLTLTVEHRWLQSGWLDSVPRLARDGHGDPDLQMVRVFNDYGAMFALFSLAIVGVIYLAVYLVERRRKEYLWFSIQGLSAICYPLFLSGISQGAFGTLDLSLLIFFLPTAALASVGFTHQALHLEPPSRAWRLLWALLPVIAILGADPFAYGTFAAPATIGVVAIVVLYQLWTCGRLAVRPATQRPVGARYLVIAWLCLAVCASFDLLAWLGIADLLYGVRGGSTGLGLFAIAQALLLGRQHIKSLQTSDELNAALTARISQLEGRQREIELLNQELRRQISDRSGHLLEALRTVSTAAPRAQTLAEGEVIEDRYRIVRTLGSGGMGAVYEVVRTTDERRFALKVTRQRDAVALARLAREAQIAAQVVHPNVVAIADVDIASAGFLYMVIELVSGKALNDRDDRYRDVAWMLPVLAQVARGLAALHEHGIVHRDLKPANILIDDSQAVPVAKIADFGISRIAPVIEAADDTSGPEQVTSLLKPTRSAGPQLDGASDEPTPTPSRGANPESPRHGMLLRESSSSLTQTGFVAGTPMYMAPELGSDLAALAPSADIFSFGVVAFLALSGQLPWTEPAIIARLQGTAIVPPRSIFADVPELPRPIGELLARCLSLDPSRRPSAAELADALSQPIERQVG